MSQIYSLLQELLRRLDYNSQEAQERANCSTSGLNQMPMEEFIPEIENEPLQTHVKCFPLTMIPKMFWMMRNLNFVCRKFLKMKPNFVNKCLKICLYSLKWDAPKKLMFQNTLLQKSYSSYE